MENSWQFCERIKEQPINGRKRYIIDQSVFFFERCEKKTTFFREARKTKRASEANRALLVIDSFDEMIGNWAKFSVQFVSRFEL